MIVNLQRKVKLEARGYVPFLAEALAAIDEAAGGEAAVAFVSDRRMRELNKFFRGKDATTDVLSFPHEPDEFEVLSPGFSRPEGDVRPPKGGTPNFLGDIVISAEQAARQAAAARLPLELEIKQLILHGLLHLCGYDHETDTGQMNTRELALRNKLAIE
ncbi:MAG: rRNA maturation RNase YbeY [Acidobacteria bacterium]|nr:rRNA maturation RNase YbeY [Acidobacteriota bacterium]